MKKLQELSTEELTKRKSLLTGCLIAFGILVVFAAFLLIFLKAKPVFFIPLFVFPVILMPIFISLKPLSNELKARPVKNSEGVNDLK